MNLRSNSRPARTIGAAVVALVAFGAACSSSASQPKTGGSSPPASTHAASVRSLSSSPRSTMPASSSPKSSSGVTGTWTGTWTSTKYAATSGDFRVVFTQQGAALTGRITIQPSCIPAGTISGAMSGTVIHFGQVRGSSRTVDFTGAVQGNAMYGTYHSDPGCGSDRGTWKAHR